MVKVVSGGSVINGATLSSYIGFHKLGRLHKNLANSFVLILAIETKLVDIFTESTPRLIQSSSRNVHHPAPCRDVQG